MRHLEGGRPARRSASHSGLAAAVVLLVAVLGMLSIVLTLAVDVPVADQWWYAEDLARHLHASPTVLELARPLNEHRLLFPRALMLLLARFTGWDVRAEMLASWLVALMAMVALLLSLRRVVFSKPFALVAVTSVYFSLTAWQNWLWGWQVQVWMNVLGVVVATVALAGPLVDRIRIALAGVGFILAAYSFASGVALGPVGLYILCSRRGERTRSWWWALMAWSVLTLLVALHYAIGYSRPPGHPALAAWPSLDLVVFALVYLGAPLAPPSVLGTVPAGILGGMGILGGTLLMIRARPVREARLAGGLLLYGACACAVTTLGRAGFGLRFAYEPRYATFAALFWIGLIVLVARSGMAADRAGRRWRGAALAGLSALGFLASALTWPAARAYAYETRVAREFLLSSSGEAVVLAPTPGGGRIVPRLAREAQVLQTDPEQLQKTLPILRASGLSLFRRPLDAPKPLSIRSSRSSNPR